MTRAHYFDDAQLVDVDGFVKRVTNPEITVYEPDGTTPISATIYAADTGGTTLTNPFTGATDGTVEFYLDTPQRVSVNFDGTSAGLGDISKIMDPGNLNTGLYSSDGTQVATLSDDGVFTAPGLLRGFGIYNVADHGLVAGSGSTYAAANTTAFQNLWTTVATAGGGTIYFPPGTWALNATTLNHALGSTVSINVIGSAGAAVLNFYGATGPFLDVASGSSSPIGRCLMRDLRMQHAEIPTSGATVQLGYVSQLLMQNIRIPNAGNGLASLTSVRLTVGGLASFRDCKFETRTDITQLSYDGLTPLGLDVATSVAVGGLFMDNTDWSGCLGGGASISGGAVTAVTVSAVGSGYASAPTVSFSGGGGSSAAGTAVLTSGKVTSVTITNGGSGYTSAPSVSFSGGGGSGAAAVLTGLGTGIRFVNSAIVDTIWWGPGTLIKDWSSGITKTGGAGGIANVMAHGLTIDGCTTVNIQLDPPTSSSVGTWLFSGCWFASETYNVIMAESGGTLAGITFENCYFTNATVNAFNIATGVDNISLIGNIIGVGGSGWAVTVAGTCADILIASNRIAIGSSGAGLISVGASVDPVVVNGNILRGGLDADGISFGGSTGASRVNANNAYLA